MDLSGYDWEEAFAYFPANIGDISRVIKAEEGENDGADWVVLAETSKGQFLAARAGCDYTGWDCQAGGSGTLHNTEEDAIYFGPTKGERERFGYPEK